MRGAPRGQQEVKEAAMRLFDRIATMLRADAHGVVESLEERGLLLKQYLREAEIELNQNRARLEAVREEEKRLGEALGRAREEVRALDEDVALALAGDKEDLARFAIRRLLPKRAEVKSLQARHEERGAGSCALAERLAARAESRAVAGVLVFAAASAAAFVAQTASELAVGLAIIVGVARVVLHPAAPARTIVREAVLLVTGLLFARLLAGPSLASIALAVWVFLLVQSFFFLGGGRRAVSRAQGDAFEEARRRALALLEEA